MKNLSSNINKGGVEKKSKKQQINREQLADKLALESKLVRNESMKVLSEFEKLNDEHTAVKIF